MTQAAINAGYSEKTAGKQASALLKTMEIQEYLKKRKTALVKDIQEDFVFECQEAVEAMKKILSDPNSSDKNKITVARDFLDRAGFKPSEEVRLSGKVENSNPYEGLTTEQLIKLAESGTDE